MANEQNLEKGKATQFKSGEQAAEAGRKGGIKSGQTKRRRKLMREAFDELLSREYTDRSGNQIQGVEAISMKAFQAAMDGDLKAVQFIRDTVGEMPVQRVEVDTIDPQARTEMDELLGLNE